MPGTYARYEPITIAGGGGGGGGGGANTSLSNLITTSINESLVPGTNDSLSLGSAAAAWLSLYVNTIYDDTGSTNPVIDLGPNSASGEYLLYDGAAVFSIDFGARKLFDASQVVAIDYANRRLQDSTGAVVADWTTVETFTVDGNLVVDLLTTTANLEVVGQAWTPIPTALAPSGTTQTVSWNNSNVQTLNLGGASGTVTVSLTNGNNGGFYTLVCVQGATPRNAVFPGVLWPGGTPPTLTNVADAVDIITFIEVGGVYYGVFSQNFS